MDREEDEQLRRWLLAIHEIARVWRVSGSSRDDAEFALDSLRELVCRSRERALPWGALRPALDRFAATLDSLETSDDLEGRDHDHLLALAHELLDAF